MVSFAVLTLAGRVEAAVEATVEAVAGGNPGPGLGAEDAVAAPLDRDDNVEQTAHLKRLVPSGRASRVVQPGHRTRICAIFDWNGQIKGNEAEGWADQRE